MKNILISVIILFTGCATFAQTIGNETKIVDVQHHGILTVAGKDYKVYEKVWSNGKILFFECDQIPGFNLVKIESAFFKGDVYLDGFRVSSGGHGKMIFKIDLSKFDLPQDWTERVFWIVESSYSSPFSRAPLEIKRLKVNVYNKES
jgi:hypothetical protein